MAFAQHLMMEKKFKNARNVLLPIAYAPHAGGGRDAAREMIATIDGKPAPASKAETTEAPSGE
ncbi:hypothetical protein [Sphingobium boeckii]|uniref:Uncharacterized protein n=1 Tax=Sphingobium boeckii TaxID=1082345 RepID=A0A7W9AHA3_9SPHN|nr:hypothetical protein [Sphingobium boeckii]MBB5685496.1 hypothetical protein [Sphingobium boeckii]